MLFVVNVLLSYFLSCAISNANRLFTAIAESNFLTDTPKIADKSDLFFNTISTLRVETAFVLLFLKVSS